jgi:hypothetical protein
MFVVGLFAVFSIILSPLSLASCDQGQCPFSLDLKRFDILKTNPNVTNLKIQKLNALSAKASGKLTNGNPFAIKQTAGDAFTMKYCTIMATPAQHPLSDKAYWISQALIFAEQIWDNPQYLFLKNNIAQFALQPALDHILLFERFSEGNYQSITISQNQKQTTIELQQTAD